MCSKSRFVIHSHMKWFSFEHIIWCSSSKKTTERKIYLFVLYHIYEMWCGNERVKTGEYTILEKPQSNATWWNNFNRIKDKDDKMIDLMNRNEYNFSGWIGFGLSSIGSGRVWVKLCRVGSGSGWASSGRIGLGFK